MNTRIYKEYRILRPFWAIALLLPLVPLMLLQKGQEQPFYCAMGYVVGCLLLGAASFGAEWNHHTMDLLLSQPLSRRQMWRDKIRMLALALGSLGLVYCLSLLAQFRPHEAMPIIQSVEILYGLIWLVLPIAWALGAGPYYALHVGNSLIAFVCSLASPLWWVLMMGLLFPADSFTGEAGFAQACCVYAVPLILIAVAGYRMARFRFHHLETAGFTSPAIRPIEWLSALFKSPAMVAPAHRGGALGKLIRKELRLHEVSLLIAGWYLFLCALIMAYRPFYGAFSSEPVDHSLPSELIMILSILTALIIPMLAGAVAVAEERQIGILAWHLTLPPSRFRQWLVKTLTAYGCTMVLGIMTPTVMVLVSGWLSSNALDSHFKMTIYEYLGLCSLNLLMTTVCLVASSLSQTSLRAILLSLGTMVLTGLTIDILRTDKVGEYLLGLATFKFLLLPILMLSIWSIKLHPFALIGVGAAVMLLMVGLSYANYRRLETRLRPAIQIVLVSLALAFLTSFTPVILRQLENIGETSKDTSLSGRTLLAYMRNEDPQRVVAELGAHLNNPASAPAAMSTLIPYGDTTPEALPLIVGGLTHPNPEVQYGATWGVEKCWTNLQNQSSLFVRARVTLYQNLQNTNTKLAHTTALVLGRVDTGTIIDALNGKPADSTAALVPGAPDNLGNLIREKYVPLLVEVYNSDQSRSSLVIDLLGKLGPGARQAIPALLKVAQSDRNFITRNGAIKALEKVDPNVVRIHNLKLSPDRRWGLDDAMRRRYGLGKPAPDDVRTNNLKSNKPADQTEK